MTTTTPPHDDRKANNLLSEEKDCPCLLTPEALLIPVVQEWVDQQAVHDDIVSCPPPLLPAPTETKTTYPSNECDNLILGDEPAELINGMTINNDYLTPEDLLDQVLRGRRAGTQEDAAAAAAGPRHDTATAPMDYGGQHHPHHRTPAANKHEINNDDIEDDDEDTQALVDELDANFAAVPPPMKRQSPHSSPGAFGLAHGVDSRAAPVSAARRHGDHCHDNDSDDLEEGGTTAENTDDDDNNSHIIINVPPIRAILVDEHRSNSDPAISIYTAEVVIKHSFHRTRWDLVVLAMCAMGMVTIIVAAVIVATHYAADDTGSDDRHDDKVEKGEKTYKASSVIEVGKTSIKPYYSHHGVVFGTTSSAPTTDCSSVHNDADTKLNVTVACYDGYIILQTTSSNNIVCHALDNYSLVCDVPLGSDSATIEFLSFDCFHSIPSSPIDVLAYVDISVPSLLGCFPNEEGEPIVIFDDTTANATYAVSTGLAFTELLRFCDDPWDPLYTTDGTECSISDRLEELPYALMGACVQDCPVDGCKVQAHDSSGGGGAICRPLYNDQDSEQVELTLESIRSDIVQALNHSSD